MSFTNSSPLSGTVWDFHPQVVAHAGHTKEGRFLKNCLGMEIDVAVKFDNKIFNIKTTITSNDITDYLISYCTMLAIDCKLSQAAINGDLNDDCSGYLNETVNFDGQIINVSAPITPEMIEAYN